MRLYVMSPHHVVEAQQIDMDDHIRWLIDCGQFRVVPSPPGPLPPALPRLFAACLRLPRSESLSGSLYRSSFLQSDF